MTAFLQDKSCLLSFELRFECCESLDITEGSLLNLRSSRLLSNGFLSLLSGLLFLLRSLPSAEVRKENALSIFVELNYLEVEYIANSNVALVSLNQVTRSAEAFNALFE